MVSMRTALLFQIAALLLSFPAMAEARDFSPGDRVLVKGRFERKCSARVESVPSPGYFRLAFDHSSCGDRGQPYVASQLQNLTFVQEAKSSSGVLKAGDHVVLQGFHSRACTARVKELTRAGYVSLEFDSLFCADTEALRKATELTKVSFVDSASDFTVGQRVSVPGIAESDLCSGTIRRLTDNGLAAIDFEQLTCALGEKLYSLDQLKKAAPNLKRRQASGEAIFKRVMREISSMKKSKRSSRRL